MIGVEARAVDVEVHLVKGLPGFELVGLPEAAVRESRVRVRAALSNSGFELPPRRVVLNLAPADLKKRGSSLDLAIAIALLSACGACAPNRLEETLLFGELSLSGELRPSHGLLPQLREARARGLCAAIVPSEQLAEAALVTELDVFGARELADVVGWFNATIDLPRASGRSLAPAGAGSLDLADVHGQASAKRALEIAATGAHHLLLVGSPGAGKTMLARRLPGILPAPGPIEALEIATVASVAGIPVAVDRPFRAPHHTASTVALVGGGDPIRPGEVTLAHRGVLFLDELPEFGRAAIEAFRTILETGTAVVVRAKERVVMPAQPLIVAAMNPCPCGFDGDPTRLCACPPSRVEAYRARISGPILDRFDLHVALPPVDLAGLAEPGSSERTADVRARVREARARLDASAPLDDAPLAQVLESLPIDSRAFAISAAEALGLSMRGFARGLRVARTIAALAGVEAPAAEHVAEAFSYRLFDRAPDRALNEPRARAGI